MYFSDPLFRFQSYLSGAETVGSQPLDARSHVLDIEAVWDDYRGDGITVAVAGPVDRTHPDLVANYDTRYLNIYDPIPDIAGNPSLVFPTFFAGIIGADDNGTGLVGVSPDVRFVPLVSQAYADIDIITTVTATERTDNALADYAQAPFGRDGKGVIVVATSPLGDTLFNIGGNQGPTGETNSEYALSGLRHVITAGAVSAYSQPQNNVLSGDMTLVASPVFTDASSTNFFSDVSVTLGLDPSGDLGGITTGETLGFWQVLAETAIGSSIPTQDYFINATGAGAGAVTSGVAALMLEANGDLGWRDVQEIMAYSARQIGPGVGAETGAFFPKDVNGAADWNGGGLIYSSDYGFGGIDPHGAVRLAETWGTTSTSANEVSVTARLDGALPSGVVSVNRSYSFTFDAPQDMRIEHVTLDVDYFAQGGLLGQEADKYIIRVISPNGTVSDLTGNARVFQALNTSRMTQELTSRNFWGENTDDGDGEWTVQFITDERSLNTQFFDVGLSFYGAAASADDRYVFTDDFMVARAAGNSAVLTDAAGENTINAAAMQADLVLTAVAGQTARAGGETLYQLANSTRIAQLIAGDGDDVLTGGAGAQTLYGGRGNDTVSGGAGSDTYVTRVASTAVTVTADANWITLTSADGVDRVNADVENFRFADQTLTAAALRTLSPLIEGTAAGENVTGTEAAERINALAGSDWITPSAGSDTVDGGAGTDMISFVDAGAGVSVNLAAGTARTGDDVNQISNIENVTGSIYADFIEGDAGDNRLRGMGNYDWFTGSGGNDTIDGGSGRDMVSYANASGAVTVDLGAGRGTAGQAAGDTYTSIERVTGSVFVDTFYGDAGENDFRGLGGFDTFYSSTGGRERYDGGNGSDTVTYVNAGAGVTASLARGFGSGGDAARDLYTSIENLGGSAFDDALSGDAGRNNLRGLGGDDFLFGAGGIDRLAGGRGNDTIDGGSGSDFALFNGDSSDFEITRDAGTRNATVVWTGPGGGDGTDRLISVEYMVFDDTTINIWSL